ncbi:MAG: hypothetical protein JNL50_13320 [Phycisphaerae bacterium]|nr:hypothetical protein [Phycisphaerae bacterium]
MSQGSPPVLDYDIDAIEPPRWPKAVGITSIVIGSIMVGCAGCGVVGLVVAPSLVPEDMKAQMPPSQASPGMLIHLAAGAISDILLIVAGAMTVGRKIAGRHLHLAYAGFAIVLFGIGVWLQFQQQAIMQQWAAQNPDNPQAKAMSGPMGNIGLIFGIAIGALFGVVYPVFLIIWFGMVKRTQESMTGGIEREMPAA